MTNIVKKKEALTRDKTLCIASYRDSVIIIMMIYYLSRKNSTRCRIFRSLEKSGHTKYGATLIMTDNGAYFVVTKAVTRPRDLQNNKTDKRLLSRGKRGLRLAGFEPAT